MRAYTLFVLTGKLLDQSTIDAVMLCTCANLRKAARTVTQVFDEAVQPVGLRATQVTLLVAVAARGPIPISALAEILVTDRTTLTRNLNPLERDGLLKIASGEDQRTRLIQITAKGQAVVEEALPLWEQAQSKMIQELGRDSWQTLIRLLNETVSIAQKR